MHKNVTDVIYETSRKRLQSKILFSNFSPKTYAGPLADSNEIKGFL